MVLRLALVLIVIGSIGAFVGWPLSKTHEPAACVVTDCR